MENKKNLNQIILSSIAIIILLVAVMGISYAVWSRTFQGTKENSLTTDVLSFSYVESETNNIDITNALPMSDINGKNLTGEKNTFDFTITSNKSGDKVLYDVYVTPYIKELPEQYIKVYLTDQNNNPVLGYENRIPTYNNLNNYSEENEESKILYSSELDEHNKSIKLRLRVWLSEEYDLSEESLTFAFRVNVRARI